MADKKNDAIEVVLSKRGSEFCAALPFGITFTDRGLPELRAKVAALCSLVKSWAGVEVEVVYADDESMLTPEGKLAKEQERLKNLRSGLIRRRQASEQKAKEHKAAKQPQEAAREMGRASELKQVERELTDLIS